MILFFKYLFIYFLASVYSQTISNGPMNKWSTKTLPMFFLFYLFIYFLLHLFRRFILTSPSLLKGINSMQTFFFSETSVNNWAILLTLRAWRRFILIRGIIMTFDKVTFNFKYRTVVHLALLVFSLQENPSVFCFNIRETYRPIALYLLAGWDQHLHLTFDTEFSRGGDPRIRIHPSS